MGRGERVDRETGMTEGEGREGKVEEKEEMG